MNKKIYEKLGYGINEDNIRKLIEFLGYEKHKIELDFDLKKVKEWLTIGEGLKLGKLKDNTIVLMSKDNNLTVFYIYSRV